MTDVEILQECRMATMEERALSKQIDRLAMIGAPRGIGSQAIEPAADRRTNNALAGQMQMLDGLIKKLIRKRDENLNIIEQAEKVIERIACRRDRVVVRCYYIEGESEYEIAREMDKSRQWVNQCRNRVLEEIVMPKKVKSSSRNVLK